MRISIGCVVAKVLSADTKELEWIERELSFTVKNGNNSRIESLLWQNQTFPSGLVPFLEKQAGLDRVHIEWMDTRSSRNIVYDESKASWLRDYQKQAVLACLQHLRGIVDHVTGSGKGDTIASLCWTLTGKTLVCVPSKALVQQQAKRIRDRTSLKVDIFGDGFHDTKARIIVATYSALHVDSKRAIPKFPWAQIENVLFDEVHSIAAHTTWGVAAKLTHASVRLGFSATPHQRLDRKSVYVYGATGKIIHRLKPLEAHQLGAIALPDIKMYLFRHGVYSSRLDPRKASITYCHSRNELIKKVALLAPTPSIIFVAHTEHAEELLNYIPDSKVVHGKLSTKEQEQLKNDLGSSKLKRLISTPVFKQGVDIPELMSVVLASPTNSVIDTLQRIGRGTRRWAKDGSELKAIFPVYDIYDAGLPNLETQSMSRLSAYKKAGYPVSVV